MTPLPLTAFAIVLATGFIAFLGMRLALVTALMTERRQWTAVPAARAGLALVPLWPWLVATAMLLATDGGHHVAPLLISGMTVECALLLLGNMLRRDGRSAVAALDDPGRLRGLTAALMAMLITALLAAMVAAQPAIGAGAVGQLAAMGPGLILLIAALLVLIRMDRAAALDGDDALGLPRSPWYAGAVTRDLALEQSSRALILRGVFSALALAVWVPLLILMALGWADGTGVPGPRAMPVFLALVLSLPQIMATRRLGRGGDGEAALIRPLAGMMLMVAVLGLASLIAPLGVGIAPLHQPGAGQLSAMAASLGVVLGLIALAVLDGGWRPGHLVAVESWAGWGALLALTAMVLLS
ncbi:hypothetical protein [Yunchengibacter salinarum]|uniref:hypothetical protein n=1 Tax=Yunchengibacter salinarum TaxID=3133399 RepID=UPI0035B64D1E